MLNQFNTIQAFCKWSTVTLTASLLLVGCGNNDQNSDPGAANAGLEQSSMTESIGAQLEAVGGKISSGVDSAVVKGKEVGNNLGETIVNSAEAVISKGSEMVERATDSMVEVRDQVSEELSETGAAFKDSLSSELEKKSDELADVKKKVLSEVQPKVESTEETVQQAKISQ